MISQRPAEAASRAEAGHWEGDLIMGRDNRSAIGTLVDRASRFTILVHLPGRRHAAETVTDALMAAMESLPAELRRSLTWDQGKEMALHADDRAGARNAGVLLRAARAMAAADEREYKWAAASVLPQGQRLESARPRAGWPGSPRNSTTGRARPSAGTPQQPA